MLNPAGPDLDQAWIASRLPHGGRMCLLERVLAWDAAQVVCRADNHRDPQHPLRQFGRLGAACGVEYAAQAMALHCVLADEAPGGGAAPGSPAAPLPGMLVGVRDLRLRVTRLDDVAGPLQVRAERLGAGEELLLYAFSVFAGPRLLLDGRASILLGRGAGPRDAASP